MAIFHCYVSSPEDIQPSSGLYHGYDLRILTRMRTRGREMLTVILKKGDVFMASTSSKSPRLANYSYNCSYILYINIQTIVI